MHICGMWHRCLPYVIKRFVSESVARLWAAKYGYQFDGFISAALLARVAWVDDSQVVRLQAEFADPIDGGGVSISVGAA